jgi:hypothetical protein
LDVLLMRTALSLTVILGLLSSCGPTVPNSAPGVGFDNSLEAQRAREAALAGQQPLVSPLPSPTAISDETLPPAQVQGSQLVNLPPPVIVDGSDPDAALAAQTAAALNASGQGSGTGSGAVVLSPATGLSRENDFEAVSEERSIESDAARITANQQQYQQVAPTAVPTRPAGAQPNVVSFALATSHPRGTRLYSRSGMNLNAKAERNCGRYTSPDQAQLDFLTRGGPESDSLGLDPDGDGYACAWDPSPFRRAVQN